MPPLATVRRQQLLTQSELAARAGLAVSTVRAIEAGHTRPRARVMRAICTVLGLDPAQVDEFRAALGIISPSSSREAAGRRVLRVELPRGRVEVTVEGRRAVITVSGERGGMQAELTRQDLERLHRLFEEALAHIPG